MKKYKMDRIDQMKEILAEKKNLLVNNRINKMEKAYLDNICNIKVDLEKALRKLTLGKEGGRLVISFLRSSYIVNSHEFYIAYYKGDAFVEEEPECIYFSMQPLFSGIEEDLKEITDELHGKFIRVLSAEKEEACRWYMEHIYSQFIYVMETAVNCMEIKSGIDIYYGGYMDRVNLLGKYRGGFEKIYYVR